MKSKLALLLLLLVVQQSAAQESEATSKPWWNPFGNSAKQETKKSSFFNSGGSGDSMKMPMWSWPSLGPSQKSTKPKIASAEKSPSSFDKFNSASKKFWTNTVDFMNPFDRPKKQTTGRGYRPQQQESSQKKGGFFSWLSPPPQQEVADVKDFLGRPRPRF